MSRWILDTSMLEAYRYGCQTTWLEDLKCQSAKRCAVRGQELRHQSALSSFLHCVMWLKLSFPADVPSSSVSSLLACLWLPSLLPDVSGARQKSRRRRRDCWRLAHQAKQLLIGNSGSFRSILLQYPLRCLGKQTSTVSNTPTCS